MRSGGTSEKKNVTDEYVEKQWKLFCNFSCFKMRDARRIENDAGEDETDIA